jgi:putative DNA primase/helicase
MKPNLDDIRKFKRFFHQKKSVTFQLFTQHPVRRKNCDILQGALTKTMLDKIVKANTNKMEIGMVINDIVGPGRKSANVKKIVALYVDCDDGQMSKDELLELPVPPDMIVGTSPGNNHAYWLIKNCQVSQFKVVQKALAAKLGTDEKISDAGRAMRLAGTVNWKREEPFLTRIVHANENAKPVSLKVFIKKMKLQVELGLTDELATSSRISVNNSSNGLDPAMRSRIENALDGVPAEDRSIWLRCGMAIHSVDTSTAGYILWTGWSRTSPKFDEVEQEKCWREFKNNGGVNIETLFWIANQFKNGSGDAIDQMSMAQMFAASANTTLRYDYDRKEWMHNDGVTWKVDAQAPLRKLRQLVDDWSKGEKGKLSDAVKPFRSTAAMRAVVSQAELLDEFHISAQVFDRNPDLLAVQNGVINLRTGAFRKAVPEDYLRRKASVEYSPDAKCPEWINFMKAITCHDRELYSFIRGALGYTLFGHANLQVFFMMIGSGGNGKGTMIRPIQKILGDYAITVAPNLLTSAYSSNVNGPSPALAKLHGARLVVCAEMPSNRGFDEAFIKQYAGGDEITARPSYGEVFSFKPEGKLWLSANDPPEIRANDEAMWRRLIPIPFNARFQGEQRDNDLEKKFEDEYAGILNWLVRGAKEYASTGLGTCHAVEKLKGRMRKESDSVLAWLSNRCRKCKNGETQASIAYEDYADFTKKMRRRALAQPVFRHSLQEKGFLHRRKNDANYYYGFVVTGR